MARIIRPKNWHEFQHYKDRAPAWIKLHRRLLDDYEYQCLPLASRALAPTLWLLASEHQDGGIDADDTKLAFRLRVTVEDLRSGLEPLLSAGFFEVVRDDKPDASAPLAECKQESIPEKRTSNKEQVRGEKNIARVARSKNILNGHAREFGEFWSVYPKRVAKGRAEKAYAKALLETEPATILAAARRYAELRKNEGPTYTAHPATWLNGKCWTDDFEANDPDAIDPKLKAVQEEEARFRKEHGFDE